MCSTFASTCEPGADRIWADLDRRPNGAASGLERCELSNFRRNIGVAEEHELEPIVARVHLERTLAQCSETACTAFPSLGSE